MQRSCFPIAIVICAAVGAIAATAARAQAPSSSPPASASLERQWYPVPTILPGGAKVTFVQGDPYKRGEFTVEFAMPDGYALPPHTNPAREHVTIVSGALRVGIGRKIDRRKSLVLAAGDTASTPAGAPHWSIAQGETHIVVTYESGPYGIAYMSVRDEPGGHAFPSGY